MNFEQHQRVDEQQSRLDQMDLANDNLVGLDPAKAEEMSALYITRVDELQNRLAALMDNAGGAGFELESSILTVIADYLGRTDAHNLESAATAFSQLLDEQFEATEELELQVPVPENFYNLSSILLYNPDEMTDYYRVYIRSPESARISIEDIDISLHNLDEAMRNLKFASKIDPNPQREQILAEAFAFLIQGDKASFDEYMSRLDLETQFFEAQTASQRNTELAEEIRALQERSSRLQQLLEELRQDRVELQKKNPGPSSRALRFAGGLINDKWHEGNNDDAIRSKSESIRDIEFKIYSTNLDLQSKQTTFRTNEATILGFQYRAGVASGNVPQDTLDRMILEMAMKLGDDMPEDLRDKESEAYQRLLSSDNVTEFEIAYYSGEGAVELAVSEYNEAVDAGGDLQNKQEQLYKAMEGDPALSSLRSYSSQIFEVFGPMAQLIQATKGKDSGAATIDSITELRRLGDKLKDIYDEVYLRTLISDARSSLQALDDLNIVGDLSEFGTAMSEVISSLGTIETLANERSIPQLCDAVHNMHADDFNNWCTTTGVVLVAAVGVGVLCATGVGIAIGGTALAAGFSGGFWVGMGALALTSAAVATGSLIGAELGKEASDAIFDTGLESDFMMAVEGKKEWSDVAAGYAKQWGVNFALSMALLGAGKAFCAAGSADIVLLTRFSRSVQNAAGYFKPLAILDDAGAGGKFAGSFFSEVGEEIAEDIAQGIHPTVGAAVMFWNSLDGQTVSANLDGSTGVSFLNQQINGNTILTNLEYRQDMQDALTTSLRSQHDEASVSVDANGIITCKIGTNLNGRSFTNTLVFKPTIESPAMRRTLSQGGKLFSAAGRYGIKFNEAERVYTYDALTSRTGEGFFAILERDGYIVTRAKKNGEFEARKGSEAVRFKPNGALRTSDAQALDAIIETDARAAADHAKGKPAEELFDDATLDKYPEIARILSGDLSGFDNYKGIRDLGKKARLNPEQQLALARKFLENSGMSIEDIIVVEDTVGGAVPVRVEGTVADILSTSDGVESTLNRLSDVTSLDEMDELIKEINNPVERRLLTELSADMRRMSIGATPLDEIEMVTILKESFRYLSDYKAALREGSIGTITSSQEVFDLLRGNQRRLAHQTIVDRRFFTGSDHGVTHILDANMAMADRIFADMGERLSPRDRILIRQSILDHDMGYTINVLEDAEGGPYFDLTKDHPLYSTLWLESRREEYVKYFGEDGYAAIRTAVLDHSNASKLDLTATGDQLIANVVSGVDCLGTTADIKMMKLFRNPEMMGKLLQLKDLSDQFNAAETDAERESIRRAMTSVHEAMEYFVEYSDFPRPLKDSYLRALDRNFDPTKPEFAFNRDFGSHSAGFENIAVAEDGSITVDMSVNENFRLVRDMFAQGDEVSTSALAKAMDDYGLDITRGKTPTVTITIDGETKIVQYSQRQFAEDLALVESGEIESLSIKTPKATFNFRKNVEKGRELTEVLLRERALRDAIRYLGSGESAQTIRILGELNESDDFEGVTLEGRTAEEVFSEIHQLITAGKSREALELLMHFRYEGIRAPN